MLPHGRVLHQDMRLRDLLQSMHGQSAVWRMWQQIRWHTDSLAGTWSWLETTKKQSCITRGPAYVPSANINLHACHESHKRDAVPCATSQPRLMHTGRPSAGGDDESEPYLGVLSRKEVPGAERQDRPQIPGVALPSSPLHSFSPLQLVHACRICKRLVGHLPQFMQ